MAEGEVIQAQSSVEQESIEQALEEYFAATDEGRLCSPYAYDLLFKLGMLDTDGDGK